MTNPANPDSSSATISQRLEPTTTQRHHANHPHLSKHFPFVHRKTAEEREGEVIEHVPDISAPYAVSTTKSPVFAEVRAEDESPK